MACSQSASTAPRTDVDGQLPNAGVSAAGEPREGVALSESNAVAHNGSSSATHGVLARVTMQKKSLAGEYLYGADLQFSSKFSAGWGLVPQSLAIGHEIVRFQIVGDELQLLQDQSYKAESPVNTPERLLHAWKIVSETRSTITFEVVHGSSTLPTMMQGDSAAAPRSQWLRNVELVSAEKLLMLASSFESSDGVVYEFLESVMPRARIAPKASDYTPLSANPDDEPLAERYRFLTWGSVWIDDTTPDAAGRKKTSFATRYDFGDHSTSTIAWYVTGNAPDEFLPEIKAGVEGWNRYTSAMWHKDMFAFRGKLPANIAMGDPRYNVIDWDGVTTAGSAYESQATDPLTGIQSHALIYLPAAWLNFGHDAWVGGEFTEAKEAAKRTAQGFVGKTFLGRGIAPKCARPIGPVALPPGGTAHETAEDFSREVLRNTLFHEVGHALGLAHNFKGSLALDDDSHPERFSASIMDYNQYNIERSAFSSTTPALGPLLEYDRQIMSAIYGGPPTLIAAAPVLAACDDSEADDKAGGVDPFCARYDAGGDPTQRTLNAIALVTDAAATQGSIRSLPTTLRDMNKNLGDATAITDWKDAQAIVAKHKEAVASAIAFYFTAGAQSIRDMTEDDAVFLYTYKDGALRAGLDEDALRSRAWDAFTFAAKLETLPAATSLALDDVATAAETWVRATPAFASLPAIDRGAMMAKAVAPLRSLRSELEEPATGALAKVRRGALSYLVRVPSAPFAFHTSPTRLDYESLAVELLANDITSKLGSGMGRAENERTAAIGALRSFNDTDTGRAAIARVRTALVAELASATDASTRESLRRLLSAIDGG